MFKPIKALYQTDQVRRLDKIAIEEFNIEGFALMQRAAKAAFAALQKHWPEQCKIIVLCGSGNNAGDGLLIAKLAKEAGYKVEILYIKDLNSLTGDALLALQTVKQQAIPMTQFTTKQKLVADLIVDALLGTGLKGELKPIYKDAITAINDSKLPVLAVDTPSGLNADTGNPSPIAVHANITVTFVGCKIGFFTGLAKDYCGTIYYHDLDIPKEVLTSISPQAELLNLGELQQNLSPRRKTAHKGDCGHVLAIGGDYGMGGAIRMAAEAAARTGAGIITVATRPEHLDIVCAARPELMCHGITKSSQLGPLLSKATAIIVGPGLGNSKWSQQLFALALNTSKPMVIDADGLNLLAKKPTRNNNWILTPHPGEAARLLKCSTAEIQTDRYVAARKLQTKFGGICILKGAGSLIATSNQISVCNYGNPGMASGGMGDVLSGVIGGLLAQEYNLPQAANLGVAIHAKAADYATQQDGERGLLATDLLPFIRKILNNKIIVANNN